MELEFAKKEALRRTEVLGTTHYVYPTLTGEYIVTGRELSNGFEPVQTYF